VILVISGHSGVNLRCLCERFFIVFNDPLMLGSTRLLKSALVLFFHAPHICRRPLRYSYSSRVFVKCPEPYQVTLPKCWPIKLILTAHATYMLHQPTVMVRVLPGFC